MKFTNILKSIILEASKYEILLDALTKPTIDKEGNKHNPKLSKEVFDELVKADPTTRLNNVDLTTTNSNEVSKVKAGNYIKWLIKSYLNVPTTTLPGTNGYEKELEEKRLRFMEDLYKVTNYLTKFDRFKSNLPIDKRNIDLLTVKELYELVKDFSLEKTKASKEEKKSAATTYSHPGGEIVFKGNDWTVVKISDTGKLGKDAACFYGGYGLGTSKGETEWCTSAPGLSHFENHIKKGPLYVIIPNNYQGKLGEKSGLPAKRYQFHFETNQFMDADDREIDLVEFLNGRMKELKEFFRPYFIVNGGDSDSLIINGFGHGNIAKYIQLFGFDEKLFESLPKNLKTIEIINPRKTEIIIQLPKVADKLKDLNFLFLDNCIDNIPEYICNLKELEFISLVNNPKLKSIPECIIDLPNLKVLTIRNNQNLVVSKSFEEKGNYVGNGIWFFDNELN